MENLFRDDNTDGYTQAEFDAFNAEWANRSEGLEAGTNEYNEAADRFADEVARR